MTAMEIHDAIGDGMVIVLTPFAIAAALVAVFAVGVKVVSFVMYGSEGKDLDMIDSHLVTDDGKRWDFSKENHSGKARAQRSVSAYDDPGAWGSIRTANEDPDKWDGFDIVPHQGETRQVTSDMDMEIVTDAEIIPE